MKECVYCEKTDIAIFYNDFLTVSLDVDNELEIIYQDGREHRREWIEIEFCPKCGRKISAT